MLKCRKYRLSMSSSGETLKLWGYFAPGAVVQKTDYYPYGSPMAPSTGEEVNRYKFGEKEYETRLGLNFHNFEARMLFNDRLAFNRPDDLAGDKPWLSPYIFCSANPINKVDPSGCRDWPVNPTYKGYRRCHLDNFNELREGGRRHQGLDINFDGGGDTDLGAPIIATHDGTVTRVAYYDKEPNAGGNRVQITSEDKKVKTFYMHMQSINSEIKVGVKVKEGQQIGTMGGTGNSHTDNRTPERSYDAHLHYELNYNGVNINPAKGGKVGMVDAQLLLTQDLSNRYYLGPTLNTVTVTGQSNPVSMHMTIPSVNPPKDLQLEPIR